MKPRVELIYAADCPNVPAAREALLQAFAQAGVVAAWSEWERGAPESPAHTRQYGSPTVLVNGRDVSPCEQGEAGPSCRLYTRESTISGSPPVDSIAAALKGAASAGRWPALIGTLPGAGAALLPTCPLCWPVYAGILSTLGLGFLVEQQNLLPLAAILLLIALAPLVHAAYTRRRYTTMLAGLFGAALVVIGKFALSSSLLQFGGVTLLFGALFWNMRFGRKNSCPRCEST